MPWNRSVCKGLKFMVEKTMFSSALEFDDCEAVLADLVNGYFLPGALYANPLTYVQGFIFNHLCSPGLAWIAVQTFKHILHFQGVIIKLQPKVRPVY